jgi:hypothetical protein
LLEFIASFAVAPGQTTGYSCDEGLEVVVVVERVVEELLQQADRLQLGVMMEASSLRCPHNMVCEFSLPMPQRVLAHQRQVLATVPIVVDEGWDVGPIRVYGTLLGQEIPCNVVLGNPDVVMSSQVDLVDGSIFLGPFSELDPVELFWYFMDRTDYREAQEEISATWCITHVDEWYLTYWPWEGLETCWYLWYLVGSLSPLIQEYHERDESNSYEDDGHLGRITSSVWKRRLTDELD